MCIRTRPICGPLSAEPIFDCHAKTLQSPKLDRGSYLWSSERRLSALPAPRNSRFIRITAATWLRTADNSCNRCEEGFASERVTKESKTSRSFVPQSDRARLSSKFALFVYLLWVTTCYPSDKALRKFCIHLLCYWKCGRNWLLSGLLWWCFSPNCQRTPFALNLAVFYLTGILIDCVNEF